MPNFNNYMSYTELSQALFFVRQQERLLSKSELRCLQLSLQDPFLKKMLELYPLPKQSQKVVTDSLEQQRAQAAGRQVDTNVHSAIYGGTREKTARYLQQNYPTTGHADVIEKVTAFLEQVLAKEEAQAELRIAEAERYALRQQNYAAERLTVPSPAQSLEQIVTDFGAYAHHLRTLHERGSTYAWGPLSSVFQRLEGLAENSVERDEAELLLLRALDDSRTAYHSYVAGKGYTCQKGLEERLLDHHALIVPAQQAAAVASPLEQVIVTLTEVFIRRGADQQRPSCSPAFYQLYLDVAGYHVQERSEAYFELSPAADRDGLKTEYLRTTQQNGLERIRAGEQFDAFMRILPHTPCHELEEDYQHLIAFLRAQEGLLGRVQATRPHFTAPGILPEHETVIARMLERGPFIDRAHLEMVLALHDEKASLDSMAQTASLGTPGIGAGFQQSAQEMRQAHHEYLATQRTPFYHFMDEQGLRARFGTPDFHTIGCSQTVLCQWLRETQSQLSAATAQRLAVLCAQGGYAFAITLLCEREDVSDYIKEQEGGRLLVMAAYNGHTETVIALLAIGADVNLQDDGGRTALFCAAGGDNIETVKALLAAGADVNLEDDGGRTALMLAADGDNSETVRALLAAGADVNLQDSHRRTALIRAAAGDNIETIRALLAAGADVNLQDEDGRTALIRAASGGPAEIVRALLAAGADVNLQNQYGQTALFCAAGGDNTETVRALLAAGAFDHRLLLIRPLLFLQMVILKLISLFKQTLQLLGLRQSSPNPGHLFARALQSDDIGTVRTTIDAGANVNRLSDGRSALDVAIQRRNSAMVGALLESGRLAPWVMIKALKRCVENSEDHAEMLSLLLDHADTVQLIIRNGHQKAPLAWATEHQCVAAVQAFIAAGARLEEQNDHHETALMIAQRLGNTGLIALLRPSQNSEENDALPGARNPIILSEVQEPAELQAGRDRGLRL